MIKTIVPQDLDTIFEALANKHRREIIYALSLQPYATSQLATIQNLSLPAIHKHIKILKNSGMVIDKKIGRIHFLALNRQSLRSLQQWLMQYQTHWGSGSETLENYAQYLKQTKSRKEVRKKMKKFVFVYHGKVRAEDIDKDAMKKTMAKWMAWFDTFKDKMVDGGNPFAIGSKSVTVKGVETIPADMWPAKGYTIINASDIDEATEIAKGCPALEDDSEGAVHVYEALPM